MDSICLDQITNHAVGSHTSFVSLVLLLQQQQALSTRDWAWKMKDIKKNVIRRVFVLHKSLGHLNWMERSEHMAWHSMRWPLSHSISVLCALLWQSEQHFLAAREMVVLRLLGHRREKCLDVRSSQKVQLHLLRCSPLSFVSMCCWHQSKQDPPRQEGMRINCFLQVQRAIPAVCFIGHPLRFHMPGEICSFSPDELARAHRSYSVLNKSSRAAHCGLPPSRTSIQTQISLLQLGLIKPANKILYNRLIVVVVVVADIRSFAIASPVRTFLQTTDMSWTCHRLYIHSTFITWLSYSLCFGTHNCETTG